MWVASTTNDFYATLHAISTIHLPLLCLEKTNSNDVFNLRLCCQETIQKTNDNGVSIVNNPQVLIRWNRTYQNKEGFPHPNVSIQNGYTYMHPFLEAFPEVKEIIRKWANNSLDQLNCENAQLEIKRKHSSSSS